MRNAIFPAIFVACVLIGIASAYIFSPGFQQRQAIRNAHMERALYMERIEAEQTREVRAALYIAWNLIAVASVCALIYYVVKRARRIKPDKNGLLAIHERDLPEYHEANIHNLQSVGRARVEEARKPSVPEHYAPHITYHNKQDGQGNPAPLTIEARPNAPSFADLVQGGQIGGDSLLLGIDAESGEPIRGSWLDLYSTLISGATGTGKTTTQRFFAAQVAMQGARFVVIDGHAGVSGESLATTLQPLRASFLLPPAREEMDALKAANAVERLGQRRITGKDITTYPVILWMDESTKLLGHNKTGPQLAKLVEQIGQQYRKVGVYACCSGQIWTAARTTSELRDTFASAIIHRMRRPQARLLLPPNEVETVERLKRGEALLWRTDGEFIRVRIPNTTGADIARIGAAKRQTPTSMPTSLPTSLPTSGQVELPQAEAGPEAGVEVEPEAGYTDACRLEKVRELLRARTSQNQIIRQVWGEDATGGRKYQRAREELSAIIAAMV